MNAWNEILIALGGNAAMLLVLSFLARSLLQTWLAKDIKEFETSLKDSADAKLERLKSDLKSKGDASIEQLKSQLQRTSIEHEVRFSKLHEKRGDVIDKLYQRLVDVERDGDRFVAVDAYDTDMAKKQEAQREVEHAINELLDFTEKSRIYLPEHVCTRLKTLNDIMWKHVSTVAAHDWLNGSPEYIDSRRDALQAAWQAFKKEIPTTRHALEDEFRMMLGVEKSRLPGTAT